MKIFSFLKLGKIFLFIFFRFGRRKTILVGIVLLAASGIGVALVPNLASFHVMRFFNAFSATTLFQTAFILGKNLLFW